MQITDVEYAQVLQLALLVSVGYSIHMGHKAAAAEAALAGFKEGLIEAMESCGVDVKATALAGKVVRRKKAGGKP